MEVFIIDSGHHKILMEHRWADTIYYGATSEVKNRLKKTQVAALRALIQRLAARGGKAEKQTSWSSVLADCPAEGWQCHLSGRAEWLSGRYVRKGCQLRLNKLKEWLPSNLLWFRHFMWCNSQEPSSPWQFNMIVYSYLLSIASWF